MDDKWVVDDNRRNGLLPKPGRVNRRREWQFAKVANGLAEAAKQCVAVEVVIWATGRA
jgi:hypothetical protein